MTYKGHRFLESPSLLMSDLGLCFPITQYVQFEIADHVLPHVLRHRFNELSFPLRIIGPRVLLMGRCSFSEENISPQSRGC